MREQLLAVVEELKVLKAEGHSSVYLESETISNLKRKTQAHSNSLDPLGVSEPPPRTQHSKPEETRQKFDKDYETPLIVLEKEPIVLAKKHTVSGGSGKKRPIIREKHNQCEPIPEPPVFDVPKGDKQTQWNWLQKKVLECPVCNTHVKKERGKKVVFGVGNLDADIFFCGEAPGAEEEVKGEPFVGPAGQLLTKIIGAMGLSREKVYIGNIMNWRPEMPTELGNRKPYPEEMAYCLPYLRAQIEIIRPQVVVALGATAVDGLLGPDPNRKMGKSRGKWHSLDDKPLMITFHPSYLLRNNTLRTKRLVWEDMMMVMEKVGLPISEKQRGYFLK